MKQCTLIWGLLQKSGCHHLAFDLSDRVASLWPARHLCGTEKILMQGPICLDPGVWSPRAQVACCLLPIVLEGPEDD